jgi:hypothetical protein
VQGGFDVALGQVHQGQFAERHAVAGGDRVGPDEALVPGLDGRPLDRHAVNRVRAVEEDDRHVGGRGRLQAEQHGRLEGVVPRPDVRQVDDKQVQTPEYVGTRAQAVDRFAVQADDRAAIARVKDVRDADEVLGLAAEAVLRAEQGPEAHAVCCREQVRRVPEPAVDRGLVRHQPDA